ncbi:iron ABC transporter permease [Propioniciclava sp. MC1595]|uniref:ABC transporter permease n=1 Tax=Propioniciclava sp. MC1595 TaxID=2760308 RepID=UPI00166244A7|nr:iron ABC transporter permease [Propioniciclava sp. MC1595]MBB1495489.1 iron ABC transporter permease [Propioniciclava sp. MC1595]QTE25711.1 iron ABC transporter permease [Propioniciclava sp. MC1595]
MTRRVGWTLAGAVPLAFLGVFFAWPVATLVARGFFPDGAFSLEGFQQVFSEPRTWRVITTTLAQAAAGTVMSVLLGVPGAWVLYRTRFPGRWLVRAIVTIPFVLPSVVVGVAFKSLVISTGPLGHLGLDQSFAIIVASLVFFNYALVVRTVGALWASLDPRTEQAASVLGASPARVFLTVTLPALAPAIFSAAALVFLFCASAYGVVMVLGGAGYGTIETEIWFLTAQLLDLGGAAALSIVQLVVVGASLVVANRLQATQARGQRLRTDSSVESPWRLRRDALPTLVTAAVVVGLLLFPISTLVLRSLTTASGLGLDHYRNLATTGGGTLSVPVWDAVGNSLRTATVATLLALALGLLVSLVVSRSPRNELGRRGLGLLDAAFMLPLGVSAVTVGFGFLITLNRPPLDLRSSMILVPIAQAIVALPLVVRVLLPVLRAIDPRLREAAAVLGASPGKVLRDVDLAFVARGLGLATGFAFATSLGEFGATSFLARPDEPTLPVVVFRLIGRPGLENQGMGMAAAVLLAVGCAVVMGLAERMRPEEATTW